MCRGGYGERVQGTCSRQGRSLLRALQDGAEQRDHGVYPKVLWVVPDERRAEQIEEVLGQLPLEARRLFTVRPFDDAVRFLATEASS